MPKRMTRGRLEDSCLESGFLKRFLQDRLMEMMSALLPGDPVNIMAGRGEDPLPPPLFVGIRVLARKRIG